MSCGSIQKRQYGYGSDRLHADIELALKRLEDCTPAPASGDGECSCEACEIPYTPDDGSNWADPDPTTVCEAIDRLAAALALLGDGGGA